jgi:hypothetical protein
VTITPSRAVTMLASSPTNTAPTREYTSHGGGDRAQLQASAGRPASKAAQTSAAIATSFMARVCAAGR